MKLFIDSEVLRNRIVKVIKEGNRTILRVNYADKKNQYRHFDFYLPVELDFLCKKSSNSKLIRRLKVDSRDNSYTFYKEKNKNDAGIFAILSTKGVEPYDDLYIHREYMERIEIIKVWSFWDYSPEQGQYEGKIYFIKVNTKSGDFIQFYKGNQTTLESYFMFFKPHHDQAQAGITKRNVINWNKNYKSLSE